MSNIDFGQYAEPRKIEVLPEGTYKVQLTKWEKCVAKSGMEQIRYYGTVIEPQSEEGKPLIDHVALSEAAFWRVAWFIKEALGWDKEDMKSVGKVEVGSEVFTRMLDLAKGRAMWWVVTIDKQYNNNKVVEYLPDMDSDKVEVDDLNDVPDWVKNQEPKE